MWKVMNQIRVYSVLLYTFDVIKMYTYFIYLHNVHFIASHLKIHYCKENHFTLIFNSNLSVTESRSIFNHYYFRNLIQVILTSVDMKNDIIIC